MLLRTAKIHPKDYPFKAHIDAQKHLDTDELRHKIKPIETHIPTHHPGNEHKYCDKEQLCPLGKWKDEHAPAKARGFKTMREMWESDKKDAEIKQNKEKVFEQIKQIKVKADIEEAQTTNEDLKKQVADLTALVQQLLAANGNNGKK